MAGNSPIQPLENNKLSVTSTHSLTQQEIRRQLFLDFIQDKRALLPAGLSLSALIYSLLYAPILGGMIISLSIFIAAGAIACSVFLWHLVFRYQQSYAAKSMEMVARFEAEQSRMEESRWKNTFIELHQGFSEIKASDGLNALRKLDYEYQQILPVLNSGRETDLLSIANLGALVRETYYRGLSVLEDIFELERVIRSTKNSELQAETIELEKKSSKIRLQNEHPERLASIQEKIESNKERLNLVLQLQTRIEKLFQQVDRCEASLGKTRIELAALKADAAEISVDAVTETLRKTIDRAKDVQAELRRLGY